MSGLSLAFNVARGVVAVMLAATLWLSLASLATAQTPQGATLTVVSGTAAVVQANGAASQPARSGMTLGVGDSVATIGNGSTALVTFFEGSEMELGANTTILIREITTSGNQVNVTVEDVIGDTFSRIKTFANANSTYRVTNPGGTVVALVKGSFIRYRVSGDGSVSVSISCPPPASPFEICSLSVNGATVSEGGVGFDRSFFIDPKGGITEGPGNGGQRGKSTGSDTGTHPEGQDDSGKTDKESTKEDNGSGGFRIRETTPLTDQLLSSRLDDNPIIFSATGSLLALGMIGASFIRPRRRK